MISTPAGIRVCVLCMYYICVRSTSSRNHMEGCARAVFICARAARPFVSLLAAFAFAFSLLYFYLSLRQGGDVINAAIEEANNDDESNVNTWRSFRAPSMRAHVPSSAPRGSITSKKPHRHRCITSNRDSGRAS